MKNFICYSLCLMLVTSYAEEPITKAFENLAEIDELIEDLLSLTKVPGVAVGIVVDGEVTFAKGYGTRNEEAGLPVTNKTVFPLGSPSKAFTSFLIGQLIEEGVMNWDDPVCNHIPYFKLKDPHTTYNITIRDYLTHTSGYPRHEAIWFNETFSRESMIRRLAFLDPIYALREKFLYQNLGYMIVGHAAEKALGKDFSTLVHEKILQPLGMTHSTFSIAEMQQMNNFSIGYREPSEPMPLIDTSTIAPAGGLSSNIEDLMKWLKLLLNKGEGLLSSSTFNEMITPQVVSDLLCNGKYGLEKEIVMESYGLGWILLSYRGHFVAFHGGNVDGFSSSILFLPRDGIGIVVLSNKHLSPLPGILTTLLADKLLNLPFIDWSQKYKELTDYNQEEFVKNQKPQLVQKQENRPHSHALSEYSGTYTHPGYGTLQLRLFDKQLVATYNNVKMPLNHWNYDVFEVAQDASYHVVKGLKFTFQESCYGDIAAVSVPLEPQGANIIFMKQKDSILIDKSYLAKFAGSYSYMGFSFVIEHAEEKLVAKAFGQPPYELYPERTNLFKVKGLEGYTIQFLTDDSGTITAVQLIQPNNSSYTAYRCT